MSDHHCDKETLLGTMAANIENIKDDQAETKATTKKIFTVIDSLVPKVAVLEVQQKDTPTLRKMTTVGAVWGGLTGGVISVAALIYKAFK